MRVAYWVVRRACTPRGWSLRGELTFGGHVGVLDDKDPTGAARLKEWADGLRELPPGTPPTFEFQRMIHPGMVPADGNGLLAAEGQGLLQVPGEHIQSVTVLH